MKGCKDDKGSTISEPVKKETPRKQNHYERTFKLLDGGFEFMYQGESYEINSSLYTKFIDSKALSIYVTDSTLKKLKALFAYMYDEREVKYVRNLDALLESLELEKTYCLRIVNNTVNIADESKNSISFSDLIQYS